MSISTPKNRISSALPEACQDTFDLLIGTCPLPRDQPNLARSLANLAYSLVCYANYLGPLKELASEWVEHARQIHQEIVTGNVLEHHWEPHDTLKGRQTAYPQLALLHAIQVGQKTLMIALGAEVMTALLKSRTLNRSYCNQLRLDALKVSVFDPVNSEQHRDLKALGFQTKWLAGFKRRDTEARKWIELHAKEPIVKTGVEQLLSCLSNALEYPKAKRKQGLIDDSCVTGEQYCEVARNLQLGVSNGDDEALMQSMCLLTPFTPELLSKLPLINEGCEVPSMALSVSDGLLVLNISVLLPGRAQASSEHCSNNWLKVPLPSFIKDAISQRIARFPHVQTLGELLQCKDVRTNDKLLEGETCKLNATLARVRKSTALICLELNTDRVVAAYQCMDFSIVAKATLYYARITGAEIYSGCKRLYEYLGWGMPCAPAEQLQDVGSCVTPTKQCVSEIFEYLAKAVKDSSPASRSGIERLLTHFNHYTRYCVVLASFCLGLREVRVYDLKAIDLVYGQRELVVHDKNRKDARFAQPVFVNELLHQQIQKYLVHMRSLLMRLDQMPGAVSERFAQNLRSILQGQGMLFQHFDLSGKADDVGSLWAWKEVQAKFHVPANVGRHFWQNELRNAGLSYSDINRFMRHITLGVETYTNAHVDAPSGYMQRVEAVQLQLLQQMGLVTITGLAARGAGL